MAFINPEDLYFGRRGAIAGMQASLITRLLGIGKINDLHGQAVDDPVPGNFAAGVLKHLGVSAEVEEWDMSNIPAEGGCIVIANHPTGALDGLLLIGKIAEVRQEFRVMGNFLLSRIPEMKQYFIDVDPFDSRRRRNVSGMKRALEYVAAGGLLVIFPAGEVSTWQKGFGRVEDKKWQGSIVKFIRKAGVPVVPVFINAANSRLFHLMGKIHPMLRTAMLPHELLNKRGKKVSLRIGSALVPRRFEDFDDTEAFGRYLRGNIYYMAPARVKRRIIRRRRSLPGPADEVIDAVKRNLLEAELEKIRPEHKLFEYNDYEVFFAHPGRIPEMMTEIGRLREVTFREIGEGTNKHIDTDRFDEYYYQLFVWDKTRQCLVGAYRMGLGREVMERSGLDGFYTNTLFRMSGQMGDIMGKTIELGRSFIVSEYQRKPVSLMLLWKGILYVLLKHEDYRYLLGPVTISGEFEENAKLVIAAHLREVYGDPEIMSYIRPVTGFDTRASIDESLIEGIRNIDLINKLVCDIERDQFAIPVLVRKYLQLNSSVIGFNTDHEFCDALDALMLLDLKKVPENIIAMLSKELTGTDIDVIARFRSIN